MTIHYSSNSGVWFFYPNYMFLIQGIAVFHCVSRYGQIVENVGLLKCASTGAPLHCAKTTTHSKQLHSYM